MIFDQNLICHPLQEQEISSKDQKIILKDAPLWVILASSGRAAAQYQDEIIWLSAGSLLLCRGALEINPASDCHLLCVSFAGTAALSLSQKLSVPLLSNCDVCPLTAQELTILVTGMRHGETETLSLSAYQVLCSLSHADEAINPPSLPALVSGAVLEMRKNYASLYGVEELSTQFGVSKSHLVRVFGAAIGISPGQYLTNVRVDAAKILLAQRDYPLEVVATLCGFSGANYLCKVFKKHTGVSPAAYRKTHHHPVQSETTLNELEGALYI